MTTSNVRSGTNADRHRANPLGAYVATLGALILLISVFFNWVGLGEGDSEQNLISGYEADGVIPFMGLLGLGFALALLYATKRADRRQHRGLSLASMAVGLASFLWILLFLFDAISTFQYNENVTSAFGAYIGLVGALIWTVGSFLLAKEPEGDVEEDDVRHTTETHARPVQTSRHAEVTETRPANVTDRDVVERHPTDTRHTSGRQHDVGTTGSSGVRGTEYNDDRSTETRRRDEPGTR